VVGFVSESCPMAGFGFGGVELPGSTTKGLAS
jgi:hypothetical protein